MINRATGAIYPPGSFSSRIWDCTTDANELKGFVPHGVLLPRHAPHEPKPLPKVDPYDSTAATPHRGLRRDPRLSPLSGQTPSLACHPLSGLLRDVMWLSQL